MFVAPWVKNGIISYLCLLEVPRDGHRQIDTAWFSLLRAGRIVGIPGRMVSENGVPGTSTVQHGRPAESFGRDLHDYAPTIANGADQRDNRAP